MRILLVSFLVALLPAVALGQEPDGGGGGGGTAWKSDAYQVEMEVPAGWKKTLDEPKSSGSWVDLVKFEEPRAGATLTLSYQASRYRTTDEMIETLRKQFRADTSLAILRDETRTATSRRPKGVYLEYTMHGSGGAQHAVAAYWLHLGKRYRIYATVREVGWRTIGGDVESAVDSFALTGRAFSEDSENFRDEPGNYEIYFPETFTIRLPARGPRVVFQSKRLGVSIWIYVSSSEGSLERDSKKFADTLRDDGAKISKQTRPETHPALGVETVTVDYQKSSDGSTYRYRETLIVHRNRFYRFVLAGAESAFPSGEEHYKKLVRSISFLR
jgi:hypothetical protein